MAKIDKSTSIARALVDAWVETLYQDSEWEWHRRRKDAMYVLEQLCEPFADDVFTALNGERTRRQMVAEKARREAERHG